MTQREVILKNFWEYYDLAEFALKQKKFNGAVTLYYKALVELCDIALMESVGRLGANHTERFKMLQSYNPELYDISSNLFSFYRDSYSTAISETVAKKVKENVDNAKNKVIKESANWS